MVPAGQESQWAKSRIRLFLRRYGIRYPTKEICVMVQGKRVKIAFNWSNGKAGTLQFRKTKGASC